VEEQWVECGEVEGWSVEKWRGGVWRTTEVEDVISEGPAWVRHAILIIMFRQTGSIIHKR
jgi:hypothetical protein